jgi:alpha-methylacyl-CoA racemase
MSAAMPGPLQGLTIVEMAGIGPAPFAGMMLADHGARVIRIERDGLIGIPNDPLLRSRHSIALDLKTDAARGIVRQLAGCADGLIEGHRPGVMERLGLGPDELLRLNPKLVYGRVTGWGQEGPLASTAGHDIDYLAITGLLHGIGPKERPVVPANYIADYAGGGMMLAFAMVAALLHVQRGGEGQVLDCAMSDGAALIGALTYGMRAAGLWSDERESNLLDGGSATYGVYACSDGRFVALGAIEPQFREALLDGLGLAADAGKDEVAGAIAMRSRDEWVAHFDGTDACVAPVLTLEEAPDHPHNRARGTFIDPDGVMQPAPAPRYSRMHATEPAPPRQAGEDGEAILSDLGYSADDIATLRREGALL